jgi:hypothetical protein
MIWTVKYARDAEEDFRKMNPDVAERICRAVQAVANARPSQIERVSDAPPLIRIPAEGGFATVRVDARKKVLNVSRLVAEVPFDPGVAFLDEPDPPPSSDK